MGSTISERNAEPRRVSNDDIGTPLAGWLEHSKGKKVRSTDYEPPGRMNQFGHRGVIVDSPVDVWVLNEDSTNILTSGFFGEVGQDVSHDQVDTESLGPRAKYRDSLRKDVFINEECSFSLVGTDKCHDHSLSCTGGLIKERGV